MPDKILRAFYYTTYCFANCSFTSMIYNCAVIVYRARCAAAGFANVYTNSSQPNLLATSFLFFFLLYDYFIEHQSILPIGFFWFTMFSLFFFSILSTLNVFIKNQGCHKHEALKPHVIHDDVLRPTKTFS